MHIIKFRQNQWSRNPDGSLYQQICQLAQCTHILRQKLSGVPTITLCPLSFHATKLFYILQFHSLAEIFVCTFINIWNWSTYNHVLRRVQPHCILLYTRNESFLHLIFKIWGTDIVICYIFISNMPCILVLNPVVYHTAKSISSFAC